MAKVFQKLLLDQHQRNIYIFFSEKKNKWTDVLYINYNTIENTDKVFNFTDF